MIDLHKRLWYDGDMKNQAAVELGRKGGGAKHPNKGFGSLTPEQREAISRKGVEARRKKAKKK